MYTPILSNLTKATPYFLFINRSFKKKIRIYKKVPKMKNPVRINSRRKITFSPYILFSPLLVPILKNAPRFGPCRYIRNENYTVGKWHALLA